MTSSRIEGDTIERINSQPLDDYEMIGILGQGSSGTVYKAHQISKNRVVAIKEVKIRDQLGNKGYKEVINEVEVMKKIKHPNIIKLYDSFLAGQFDANLYKKKSE